jgi:hypothetical protein
MRIVGLIVDIRKVSFFREEESRGFFGGKKVENVKFGEFIRLEGGKLADGGFFGGAGYIQCTNKTCGNILKAGNPTWAHIFQTAADSWDKAHQNNS